VRKYADALGMAQGGSLAGKPRELIMRALAQDPAFQCWKWPAAPAFEAGDHAATLRLAAAPSETRCGFGRAPGARGGVATVEQRLPAAEPRRASPRPANDGRMTP
jgi:hypothetical protein